MASNAGEAFERRRPSTTVTNEASPARGNAAEGWRASLVGAEVLARVGAGFDLLESRLRRIKELEAWLSELETITPRRLEAMREQLIVAEVRAEEQEEAAGDAEEWLQRVYDDISRRFAGKCAPGSQP